MLFNQAFGFAGVALQDGLQDFVVFVVGAFGAAFVG